MPRRNAGSRPRCVGMCVFDEWTNEVKHAHISNRAIIFLWRAQVVVISCLSYFCRVCIFGNSFVIHFNAYHSNRAHRRSVRRSKRSSAMKKSKKSRTRSMCCRSETAIISVRHEWNYEFQFFKLYSILDHFVLRALFICLLTTIIFSTFHHCSLNETICFTERCSSLADFFYAGGFDPSLRKTSEGVFAQCAACASKTTIKFPYGLSYVSCWFRIRTNRLFGNVSGVPCLDFVCIVF